MNQRTFEDYVMFCNSTGNQTVNLIPAIQFRIPEVIIFSTDYTEKKELTKRLRNILTDKNIKTTSIHINLEDEKQPIALLEQFLSVAKSHAKIVWNVSGGQKIPTIALQTAFQRRISTGFNEDVLLYLEATPPETWYYDKDYKPYKVRTSASVELKDILYLYGYDLYEESNDKTLKLYPFPAEDVEDRLEIGRKALRYYKENDLFREIFFRWMKSDEPQIKNKEDIKELIKDTLNEIKPNIAEFKLKKPGYENLENRIKDIMRKIETEDDRKIIGAVKKLRIIQSPEEIYNDYWNSIKSGIISKTLNKIEFNEVKLIQRDVNKKIINEIEKQIKDIGGDIEIDDNATVLCKKHIKNFSSLKKGNGFLFEWMVAAYLYDEVNKDNCLKDYISQIHCGVETNMIGFEKKDAEMDIVVTTKFGTLIIFELKTYDFSGDTARAKEDTTYKKSGPYGKAIIIGPLLKSMVKHVNDVREYPSYIEGPIRSQQDTAEQNGIEYWYLDEIPLKLKQKLFCNKGFNA